MTSSTESTGLDLRCRPWMMRLPISMAREMVPRMANSFIVFPSMTYRPIMEARPMATVTMRERVSTQALLTASITTLLPFSSQQTMGEALTPPMLKETMGISGKARPMPSASTRGSPRRAAVYTGIVEFRPPASIGSTA